MMAGYIKRKHLQKCIYLTSNRVLSSTCVRAAKMFSKCFSWHAIAA